MKVKILYIEDEEFLGKIVKDTLEKKGYEVKWETDGARVMGAFNLFMPDVCVIDIMLPNIDGYTLSKNIRGIYPDLPIIFLTAKTETADLVKGFDGTVAGPIEFHCLAACTRSVGIVVIVDAYLFVLGGQSAIAI